MSPYALQSSLPSRRRRRLGARHEVVVGRGQVDVRRRRGQRVARAARRRVHACRRRRRRPGAPGGAATHPDAATAPALGARVSLGSNSGRVGASQTRLFLRI